MLITGREVRMGKKEHFAQGLAVLKITTGFAYTQLLLLIITVILIVGKERCIKEHIFSELLYVSCVYLISKIVFEVWNFVWSFTTKTISVSLKSLEIILLCRKLKRRKRGNSFSVFHRNSSKYSNDQKGKLDWNWLKFYSKGNTD